MNTRHRAASWAYQDDQGTVPTFRELTDHCLQTDKGLVCMICTETEFCLGSHRIKEERTLHQTERDGFPREGITELHFRTTVGAGPVCLQLDILNTGDSAYEGPGMRDALKPPESWI